MEIRTTKEKMTETLQSCNLCVDVVTIVYPNENQYWFMDTEDTLYQWYDEMEANIERNGGYMIDEWQYVDSAQNVMDLRSHVRIELAD